MNATIADEVYTVDDIESKYTTTYSNKQTDHGLPEPTTSFWYEDRIRFTKHMIECNV